MKKWLNLFIILVTIIFSTFGFSNTTFFPIINATYIEGSIIQDTIWTLVDSPFVISNDVTVYPNATLTIEPEVEIKFGGNFSILVEGSLVAEGTKDKMITFTSNMHEPEAGDWGTIILNGSQSSLIYCIIEYGTNGITVENGVFNIQDSVVSLNSNNGIMIRNGYVEVRNNEIINNTISGIFITGGNQVTVQNNVVKSNGDGVTLTGNLTLEINIYQNEILFNRQSGILLEASTYENTIILNNVLSANSYGFYVSNSSSTYITHNYISNNTVGFLYEEGTNHTAYFNDIYDNDLGMDLLLCTAVNATYNYWGDKSGPYHESLNPRGRGNPVGGDGANLDFIFFLTAPIDYNNVQPTAIFWTDKTLVAPNQNVTFIGTNSYDDGRIDQYLFDFGDGTSSGWTTLSLFTHNYSLTGTYSARLTVMDDFSSKIESSAVVIDVQNLVPLETSVTLGNYTVDYNEQVLVSVYVSDGISAVENATVTLFSVKGGSYTLLSGSTNSTGYFTTTFIAPNVTEINNVRIIARASKAGYADGSNFKYLKVLPPLTVQVTAEPAVIKSEETATVTIHVTAGVEQPVADASLILAFDYGNLSATIGVTDVNGNATFLFTAPQTLSQINTTITAIAVKLGSAEGHGQGIIIVEPKILVVEVTADPSIIVSEAVSTITAHVTCDVVPISEVTVTVSSDSGGNFSAFTEITNSHGNAGFVFTAPQTTIMLNATITVTATESGYVDGEGQIAIMIVPKTLAVQVTTESDVAVSEAKVNMTVHVTCAMIPVSNVNITMMSDDGYFNVTTGVTDVYGNATFTFVAPQVDTPRNVTIVAHVFKVGYIDGENVLNLTVNPGILGVEVKPSSTTINSRESTVVTVHVTCNGTPVEDVLVTMSSTYGNFMISTDATDSGGRCEFVFNASRTTAQLTVAITVNATKKGYVTGQKQTTITVAPEDIAETEGGWPITTILLIIIPIVIIIVVVVLVKLGVITLSLDEET